MPLVNTPAAAAANTQRCNHFLANLSSQIRSLTAADVQKFKDYAVILEYFSRPGHGGGAMIPLESPERRQLPNEEWVTWESVPLERVIKDAESMVERHVEVEEDRAKVWKALFVGGGLEGFRRKSKWDRCEPSKYEEPATPYSVSKATTPKSRLELIGTLVEAAGKKPKDRQVAFIASVIALEDSGNKSAILRKGVWESTGPGRLGRKHTLDDVPNHYVRDFLMRQIQTAVPAENQDRCAKAVFDDLSADELKAYWECIEEIIHEEEEEEKLADRTDPIIYNIPDVADLRPKPDLRLPVRNYEDDSWFGRSCKYPDKAESEEETLATVASGGPVDRDCDQIRAMVKRLIMYNTDGWDLDSFRRALGGFSERKKLYTFLERRGPKEGAKLQIFPVIWEFFKRRDMMGLPLPAAPAKGVGKKRKRDPLEERDPNALGTGQAKGRAVGKKVKSSSENDAIEI